MNPLFFHTKQDTSSLAPVQLLIDHYIISHIDHILPTIFLTITPGAGGQMAETTIKAGIHQQALFSKSEKMLQIIALTIGLPDLYQGEFLSPFSS